MIPKKKYKVINHAERNSYKITAGELKRILEDVDDDIILILFDVDYENELRSKGLYTYGDLISKLRKLDYFDGNHDPVELKHISSIGVITDE